MKQQQIMSLFTRTPLHVGAGSSVGVVDLPIIRERHTGYPVIPGSSLKGTLADLWREEQEKNEKNVLVRKKDSAVEKLFGNDRDPKNAAAGKLLIGESRIVAFPVRSAKGGFAWVTCPLALGRFFRDCRKELKLTVIKEDECLAPKDLALKETYVVLEEYSLKIIDNTLGFPKDVVECLKNLSSDELWKNELEKHLVIISDEMFKYFVENTCEVAQHVKINDETGTGDGRAFFNQENVPAETMFYAVFHEMVDGVLDLLNDKLKDVNYLIQIGADATTGLGWCTINVAQ